MPLLAGRLWHNYFDTKLDYRRSYLARLNYTHQNAVRHGLVKEAKDYPWCPAAWFGQHTSAATVKSICRFKSEQIEDDFEVDAEW